MNTLSLAAFLTCCAVLAMGKSHGRCAPDEVYHATLGGCGEGDCKTPWLASFKERRQGGACDRIDYGGCICPDGTVRDSLAKCIPVEQCPGYEKLMADYYRREAEHNNLDADRILFWDD